MASAKEHEFFAHSGPGGPGPEWHLLHDHLEAVGRQSRKQASLWGGGNIAGLAGRWHDLGKYAPDWQTFLLEVGQDASAMDGNAEGRSGKRRRGPDHSSAGAIHATHLFGETSRVAQLIAFAIAGHHSGLADWEALRARMGKPELRDRFEATLLNAPRQILSADPAVSLPEWLDPKPVEIVPSNESQ